MKSRYLSLLLLCAVACVPPQERKDDPIPTPVLGKKFQLPASSGLVVKDASQVVVAPIDGAYQLVSGLTITTDGMTIAKIHLADETATTHEWAQLSPNGNLKVLAINGDEPYLELVSGTIEYSELGGVKSSATDNSLTRKYRLRGSKGKAGTQGTRFIMTRTAPSGSRPLVTLVFLQGYELAWVTTTTDQSVPLGGSLAVTD